MLQFWKQRDNDALICDLCRMSNRNAGMKSAGSLPMGRLHTEFRYLAVT